MANYFSKTNLALIRLFEYVQEQEGQRPHGETLIGNDILALNICSGRFLENPGYRRNKDGSTRIPLEQIIVDAQSFYLFAHKVIAGAIYMFWRVLPNNMTWSLPTTSVEKFKNYVLKASTPLANTLNQRMGNDINWLYKKFAHKRSKRIQHWQTPERARLSVVIHAFNLPVLAHEDSQRTQSWISRGGIRKIAEELSIKHNKALDPNASGTNLAVWLECWYPIFSAAERLRVDNALDEEVFVCFPITPEIVQKLDEVLSDLLVFALQEAKNASKLYQSPPSPARSRPEP